MFCSDADAIDEDQLILCCATCCANCSILPGCSCFGCSGKAGLCCLNCEFCFKPGAPCLPCMCCGPKCENDGCSICNAQGQLCCVVVSAAFPCNDEVPAAITGMGVTIYPFDKAGCCVTVKEVMDRE